MPTACEPCPGKTNALVTNDPLYTNGWARWPLIPLRQSQCAISVSGLSQSISLQLYRSSIARNMRSAKTSGRRRIAWPLLCLEEQRRDRILLVVARLSDLFAPVKAVCSHMVTPMGFTRGRVFGQRG